MHHRAVDSPVYQGYFGLELQRTSVKGSCQAGVCDIAAVVDSPSDRSADRSNPNPNPDRSVGEVYSDFRQYVQSVNPSVHVVRINPTSLRLEEDTVETLISLLSLKKGGKSVRSSVYSVRYDPLLSAGPERGLHRPLRVRQSHRPEIDTFPAGLHTVRIPAPSSSLQPWSLRSIVTVLQLVFPLAPVSVLAASLSDTWQANINESRGFKRLIDLARVKVFTARRCDLERKELNETLVELKKRGTKAKGTDRKAAEKVRVKEGVSDVSMLRVGLLSVCGAVYVGGDVSFGPDSRLIRTDSNHGMWVTIEASAGAIIVKEYERNHANNFTVSSESQTLTAQGTFVRASKNILLDLFQACSVLHLVPKHLLTHSDVTAKMTEKAQLKYCGVNNKLRALPGGWWFDGNVYLDLDGNQRKFRPDIDDILDLHLVELNDEIGKYNALLEQLQSCL